MQSEAVVVEKQLKLKQLISKILKRKQWFVEQLFITKLFLCRSFFGSPILFSIMECSPQSTASSIPFDSTTTLTMSMADELKSQHRQLFNPVTPDVSPPAQISNGGFPIRGKETGVR